MHVDYKNKVANKCQEFTRIVIKTLKKPTIIYDNRKNNLSYNFLSGRVLSGLTA